MSPCWYVLIAIFHAVKVKKYRRNNNYWRMRCLQNWSLILSNTILKWSHIHSQRFLWTTKQTIFEGREKFYCGPWTVLPFVPRFEWNPGITFIGNTNTEFLCGTRCFLLVRCLNSWFHVTQTVTLYHGRELSIRIPAAISLILICLIIFSVVQCS